MKVSALLSIASVGVIIALHAAPVNAQLVRRKAATADDVVIAVKDPISPPATKSAKRGTSSPTSDTLASAKSAKAAAFFTKSAKAYVSTSSPTSDTLGSKSPTERIVFVTSVEYTGGAIGGIAGAHSKCQTLAIEAGRSGTFKAWLSDSNGNSPAQDLVKSDVPYVTTNGTKVADNWLDLITDDGPSSVYLDNAIAFDENGVSTTGSVWTGTDVNGMPESETPIGSSTFCNDWTSNSNSGFAIAGNCRFTNQGWTSSAIAFCNDFPNRLYCFEQ